MQRTRVDTPQDAYWAFDPFAVVKPGDEWYVDLSEHLTPQRYGLGVKLSNHLRLAPNAPDFVQVAVLGQSGVGKTTQVRGAVAQIPQDTAFPVMIDALTELDPSDLDFADILFTLARSVLVALEEVEIDIPPEAAEQLERYFADEVYVQTQNRGVTAVVETEAEVGSSVPFLARLLARFRGSAKAESEYRKEIRRVVQRNPSDLIRRVNYLLDEATKAIRPVRGPSCRILVLIDNLEKFENRKIVERAVISRAGELRELRCHLVVFLHPADLYAPHTISAAAAFQKTICVPSLPVRESSDPIDRVDPACVRAVRTLLDRRVVVDEIFDDADAVVERLLLHSGGHLRDILALGREACELFVGDKIGVAEIDAAARRLSRVHTAQIRSEDWPSLRQVAETKSISGDEVDGYLLLHLLVLEYNGEAWWDVHPFVRLDRRFETAEPSSRPTP